jgi:hypothetical protein
MKPKKQIIPKCRVNDKNRVEVGKKIIEQQDEIDQKRTLAQLSNHFLKNQKALINTLNFLTSKLYEEIKKEFGLQDLEMLELLSITRDHYNEFNFTLGKIQDSYKELFDRIEEMRK